MIHAAFSEKPTISVGSHRLLWGKVRNKSTTKYTHIMYSLFIFIVLQWTIKRKELRDRQRDIFSSNLLIYVYLGGGGAKSLSGCVQPTTFFWTRGLIPIHPSQNQMQMNKPAKPRNFWQLEGEVRDKIASCARDNHKWPKADTAPAEGRSETPKVKTRLHTVTKVVKFFHDPFTMAI